MSIEPWQLLLMIVACFAPSAISLADQDINLHGGKGTNTQRRAVVHIGPHKTGTTHFQEMLCSNSELLRMKGWIVPTCDRCKSCFAKQFAAVAFEFQERFDRAKPYKCGVRPSLCLASVIRQLHNNESIILSSEEFSKLKPRQIVKFLQLLHGFEVEIVFLHRDKNSMIASLYSEDSRRHSKFSLSEWLFRHSGSGDQVPGPLSPVEVLLSYGSVVGFSSIWVLSYGGIEEQGLSPFAAIVQNVLHLESHEFSAIDRQNKGEDTLVVSTSSFIRDVSESYKKIDDKCETCLREVSKVVIRERKVNFICSDLSHVRLAETDAYELQRKLPGANMRYFGNASNTTIRSLCDVDRVFYRERPDKLGALLLSVDAAMKGCTQVQSCTYS